MKVSKVWIAVWVLTLIVSSSAGAQSLEPEFFGIADANYHFVSAEEFSAPDGYVIPAGDGFWFWPATPLVYTVSYTAPMRLPTGALVTGYTVIYNDDDAVQNLAVRLERSWVGLGGTTGTAVLGPSWMSSGTPGVTLEWVDIAPDFTVEYSNVLPSYTQSYILRVSYPESDDVWFRGVIVHWYRQISPAPAVATFDDVPVGAFGFQHVEALAASGITAGCSASNFCPNQPLTRVQMAVFLAKALGLHWEP